MKQPYIIISDPPIVLPNIRPPEEEDNLPFWITLAPTYPRPPLNELKDSVRTFKASWRESADLEHHTKYHRMSNGQRPLDITAADEKDLFEDVPLELQNERSLAAAWLLREMVDMHCEHEFVKRMIMVLAHMADEYDDHYVWTRVTSYYNGFVKTLQEMKNHLTVEEETQWRRANTL